GPILMFWRTYERKACINSSAGSLRNDSADGRHGNAYDTDQNREDFVLQFPGRPQSNATEPERPMCDFEDF
ncbi:MAG: hypothetical protein AAF645_23330, partial [Myxococcota bacterium]